MKAVILAGGKSTRTYPLTLTRPKPLLKVGGTTLIEHNLSQLTELVDEAVIIIGYKGEMITKHLGRNYKGIKLTYVTQKQQLGTGHALQLAEPHLEGKFIVLMGDDLYDRADLDRYVRHELAVMAKHVNEYSNFGVFVEKEGKLLDLVEKPQSFVSYLANTGCYVFDMRIFAKLKQLKKSSRGEYELTDALKLLAEKADIFTVEGEHWMPIVYPWSLLEADRALRKEDVVTGEHTKISGTVRNCTIGKNCLIHGHVQGCIIGDNVTIESGSLLQDSILGDNVRFHGIALSGQATVMVGDKKVEGEMGCIIGDGCVLERVEVKPGALIWPKKKKTDAILEGVVN